MESGINLLTVSFRSAEPTSLVNLHHLTANVLDLLCLGIRSLLDLVLPFFGEANAEETQSVTVARLHVHASLDHRLPFLHHRSGFIGGEVITPLNILADETEFAESDFVILQISQRHLVNAALQTVRCDASSRSLVDGGFTDAPGVKHDGGSDIVPLFAGERVDDLLLLTLLASLRQTLVLSNCHLDE